MERIYDGLEELARRPVWVVLIAAGSLCLVEEAAVSGWGGVCRGSLQLANRSVLLLFGRRGGVAVLVWSQVPPGCVWSMFSQSAVGCWVRDWRNEETRSRGWLEKPQVVWCSCWFIKPGAVVCIGTTLA